MHDDHDLHDLLLRAMPPAPLGDGLTSVRASAARHVRRRRLATLALAGLAATAMVGWAGAGGWGGGDARPLDVVGAPPSEVLLHVAGIDADLRVSTGTGPVDGFTSFGSVRVGDAHITAGTQTVDASGRALAILAVSPGTTTERIRVVPLGADPVTVEVGRGPSLVVVPLPERQLPLVLEVEAHDRSGAVTGTVRVTPFDQVPLSCATSLDPSGPDEPGGPTYVSWLGAYLTGPIPPRCDR